MLRRDDNSLNINAIFHCFFSFEKNNVNNFAMSQQFDIFAKHKTPISNI